MAISGSKDIQIPYGMEIFSTSDTPVKIERNPDDPSQARLKVEGDLVVQGKARFSQGDLTISGSAFSSGGWQPLFIDDSDAVSLDTGSFHYTLDSAAGSVTIGVRQEDMFQILKPKIELAPTFNKGADYPKAEDFRFITKFGTPATNIRYVANFPVINGVQQHAGNYSFLGDSLFPSLSSTGSYSLAEHTQSYGNIVTSNVLSETVNNVLFFELGAGSLTGSLKITSLYDARPSAEEVQDYATLAGIAAGQVTSSAPYAAKEFHTFESIVNSDSLTEPHVDNVYRINYGNRYTFVFADGYEAGHNVPEDQNDNQLPTPAWTHKIRVKVLDSSQDSSEQIYDPTGWKQLIESCASSSSLGSENIYDISIGSPGVVRSAMDSPTPQLGVVETHGPFPEQIQNYIKAIDFAVNPARTDVSEIVFRIDHNSIRLTGAGNNASFGPARYMYVRFALSDSEKRIVTLKDVSASTPEDGDFLIYRDGKFRNTKITNEIEIDASGSASFTYKLFANNSDPGRLGFPSGMTSTGSQLILLSDPEGQEYGGTSSPYAMSISSFAESLGLNVGENIIDKFKSFKVGNQFLEPESPTDNLEFSSSSPMIELSTINDTDNTLVDTVVFDFVGADARNTSSMGASSGSFAFFPDNTNVIRPLSNTELKFYNNLNSSNNKHKNSIAIGGNNIATEPSASFLADASAIYMGGYSLEAYSSSIAGNPTPPPPSFESRNYGISFGDKRARIYESSSAGSVVIEERLSVDKHFEADEDTFSLELKKGLKFAEQAVIEGTPSGSSVAPRFKLSGSFEASGSDFYVLQDLYTSGSLQVSGNSDITGSLQVFGDASVSGTLQSKNNLVASGSSIFSDSVLFDENSVTTVSGNLNLYGTNQLHTGSIIVPSLKDASAQSTSRIRVADWNQTTYDVENNRTPSNWALTIDDDGFVSVARRKLDDPPLGQLPVGTLQTNSNDKDNSLTFYNPGQQASLLASNDLRYYPTGNRGVLNLAFPVVEQTGYKLWINSSGSQGEYGAGIKAEQGIGAYVSGSSYALELAAPDSPIKFLSQIPTATDKGTSNFLITSGSQLMYADENLPVKRVFSGSIRDVVDMHSDTVFAQKIAIGVENSTITNQTSSYELRISSSSPSNIRFDNIKGYDPAVDTGTFNQIVVDESGSLFKRQGSANAFQYVYNSIPPQEDSRYTLAGNPVGNVTEFPDLGSEGAISAISTILTRAREDSYIDERTTDSQSSVIPTSDSYVAGIFFSGSVKQNSGSLEGINSNLMMHPHTSFGGEERGIFRRFVFEDNISNVFQNFLRLIPTDSSTPSDTIEVNGPPNGTRQTGNGGTELTRDTGKISRLYAFHTGSDNSLYVPSGALPTSFSGMKLYQAKNVATNGLTSKRDYYLMQSSSPFQDKMLRFDTVDADAFPASGSFVNLVFSEQREEITNTDIQFIANILPTSVQVTGSDFSGFNSTPVTTLNNYSTSTSTYTSAHVSSSVVSSGFTQDEAIYLNDSYLEISGSHLDYNLTPSTSGDFILEMTCKIVSNNSRIFEYTVDGSEKIVLESKLQGGEPYLSFTIDGSEVVGYANQYSTTGNEPVIFNGTWQHLSIIYESGTLTVRVNGEEKISTLANISLETTDSVSEPIVTLGSKETGFNRRKFNGYFERVLYRTDVEKYSTNRNSVEFRETIVNKPAFMYATGSGADRETRYLLQSNKESLEKSLLDISPSVFVDHVSTEMFKNPVFTGESIAEAPDDPNDNSSRIATTSWVTSLIGGSAGGLNDKFKNIVYSDQGQQANYFSANAPGDYVWFRVGDGLSIAHDTDTFEFGATTTTNVDRLTISLENTPGTLRNLSSFTGTRLDLANSPFPSPANEQTNITDIVLDDKVFYFNNDGAKIYLTLRNNLKDYFSAQTNVYDQIEVDGAYISGSGAEGSGTNVKLGGQPVLEESPPTGSQTLNTSKRVLDVSTAWSMINKATGGDNVTTKIGGTGLVEGTDENGDPQVQAVTISSPDDVVTVLNFDYNSGKGFDVTVDNNEATVKMPEFIVNAQVDGADIAPFSSSLSLMNDYNSAVYLSGSTRNGASVTNNVVLRSELKASGSGTDKVIYVNKNAAAGFYVGNNPQVSQDSVMFLEARNTDNQKVLKLADRSKHSNPGEDAHLFFDDDGFIINSNLDENSTFDLQNRGEIVLSSLAYEQSAVKKNRVGILTSSFLDAGTWRPGYDDVARPDILLAGTTIIEENVYYTSHYQSSSYLPPAEHHPGMIAYVSGNVNDPYHNTLVFSDSDEWSAMKSTLSAQTDVDLSPATIPDNSALVWNTNAWVTSSMMHMAKNEVPAASIASSASLLWDSAEHKWIPREVTLQDLGNVNISTLTDGYVLKYDAASQKFVLGEGGGGSGNANFILSSSVPSSNEYSTGSFWYDTDDHVLYARVADTNNTEAWLEINTGGNASPWVLSQDRVILQNSAYKVGIATATFNAGAKFQVGGAHCNGTTWSDASSRELKENIEELNSNDAFAILDNLDPVSFKYKDKERTSFGFIAEDVPDVMTTANKDSLSPMQFVGVLTKVVKDQNEKLAEQSKKIDFLTEALEKLLQEKGE